MTSPNTYKVTARRWRPRRPWRRRGWELDIEGVGVTQSHSKGDAERMVRDYLDADGHSDAYDATLAWDWQRQRPLAAL